MSSMVCNGLLADLYNEVDACCIVKGVRNGNDFLYENDLWLINRSFNSRVETVFLPSQSQYSHVSSTMVREMFKYGVPLSSAMPKGAAEKAMEIYSSKI